MHQTRSTPPPARIPGPILAVIVLTWTAIFGVLWHDHRTTSAREEADFRAALARAQAWEREELARERARRVRSDISDRTRGPQSPAPEDFHSF